ncbi:MAG: SDR family oxidoreductase [Oligoflexia bacterium]|nr:SDR family oxidoreductase [Oligoflexia bacterium]
MGKKTILVTGASGFVGSHLCERFLEEGYRVYGVDNLLTGREQNLSTCLKHPDFRFDKLDVIKEQKIKSPFGDKFFFIHHFACPASPIDFEELSLEILEVDSKGTLNLLEIAREDNAGFFLASTSEVYGDPLVHPQKESYWGNVSCTGLRSCYDETKRFSEAAVKVYERKYGIDSRIVRIFNTYGPRMRLNDGRVVPQLCSQILKGEPLTVHGDGTQTRSFCFVSDLVDGIYRLTHYKDHDPFNIGNPVEYSLNEFAREVMNIAGTKSEIRYLEARPDDPRKRCPDITRAKTLLGWEPKVSLADGLKRTLESFRADL